MLRFEDIVESVTENYPTADVALLKKAYVFSGMVHQGQTRMSGEPYLIHPIAVSHILAELRMDMQCVVTGLLHDTVEDTHTTLEKIEELFGHEVASLVDGVTKISRLTFDKKQDREAENFRKMIFAMSKDIRVILIKLADRLHNMRTLDALRPDRQRAIARETMDIYAPMANRLGIGWIKTELEDLSFKYLDPDKYSFLTERVVQETDAWGKYIENVKAIIEESLQENGSKGTVTGRVKHLYSIDQKMEEQGVDFENIYDIIGFRVVVESLQDCYAVLGLIHSTWKPVPGRFKDYIALPKLNRYQSLHTTVVGPYGIRMEVQIRTAEMHRIAEYGIASHWKYKEDGEINPDDDKTFAWLRQLLEWQRDLKDTDEFMDSLKVDLFPEEVFVFTPKGDIKQFSIGSTPIDFAYAVHTDIGNRCVGAKINGKLVPLGTRLRSGDIVDIITSEIDRPRKDWLNHVSSARAKTRIRQWIKNEERTKSVALGTEILTQELKSHNLNLATLVESGMLEELAKAKFGLGSVESLYATIGYGKVSASNVLRSIVPEETASRQKQKFSFMRMLGRFKGSSRSAKSPVVVRGDDDIMVRYAQCCNPLPGDSIAGLTTLGQGLSIHSEDCANLMNVDSERLLEVAWAPDINITRPVNIEVLCRNEKGVLAEMTSAIRGADANISSAEIGTNPENRAVCTLVVDVRNTEHLKAIMLALKRVSKVMKVRRIKKGVANKDDERV
ncbi:MAG: bifunctional (p)ppGpp synthetase/guanosine-3',5'-bis(diphosphate) 3'-pyrophosphohydrolase [Proteobacteria bacterium]|nr:bifunctional (p)ppGpp synthetase/guanosine-3',5'-bis(diphosphate) 3'-pyrophosphohydrolase [Pseudomonadota bacterium]